MKCMCIPRLKHFVQRKSISKNFSPAQQMVYQQKGCLHAWVAVMKGTHRAQDRDCRRFLNSPLRAVTQHGLEKDANKPQQ